jgi:hypothetical protein
MDTPRKGLYGSLKKKLPSTFQERKGGSGEDVCTDVIFCFESTNPEFQRTVTLREGPECKFKKSCEKTRRRDHVFELHRAEQAKYMVLDVLRVSFRKEVGYWLSLVVYLRSFYNL